MDKVPPNIYNEPLQHALELYKPSSNYFHWNKQTNLPAPRWHTHKPSAHQAFSNLPL